MTTRYKDEVAEWAGHAGRIYAEFTSMRHADSDAAIAAGDYSYAFRTATGQRKRQLEELLAITPRQAPISAELLPAGAAIFKRGGSVPSGRPIRVLAQLRHEPLLPTRDYYGAIKRSQRFEVVNLGCSDKADVRMTPDTTLADVHRQLGNWRPDFFYSHQVEYQCLPLGLDRAPYPIIGHVGDLDLHWPNSERMLKMFDALTVVGTYDWHQAAALTDRPVLVYPKIYGSLVPPRTKRRKERVFDLSFAGEITDPFRYDTQLFLRQLLGVSRAFPLLDKCFLAENDFFRFLETTKVVPTYVRRWGAFSTRALEALSAGCCVLYQEGSELGFYFSQEQGAIPYRPENLAEVASETLGRWSSLTKAGQAGQAKAVAEFNLARVVEEYFDFLAFIAFGIDREAASTQRRSDPGWRTPALIGGWGGVFADTPTETARSMYERTLKASADGNSHLKALIALNALQDMKMPGKDMLLLFNLGRYLYTAGLLNNSSPESFSANIDAILAQKRYDDAGQGLGYPAIIRGRELDAVRCFSEAVACDAIGPTYDCLDYLYGPTGFDYRSYLDILWRGSSQGMPTAQVKREAAAVVRAYSWGYLFKIKRDPAFAWRALSEWPNSSLAYFLLSDLDDALEKKLFKDSTSENLLTLLALYRSYVLSHPLHCCLRRRDLSRFLTAGGRQELNRLIAHFELGQQWLNRIKGRPLLRRVKDFIRRRLVAKKAAPTNPGAHVAAWRLYYDGRYREAASEFSATLAQSDGAELRLGRGWSFLLIGKWQEASADFRRALELIAGDVNDDSATEQAMRGLGWSHLQQGDYNGAADFFQRALDACDPAYGNCQADAYRGRSRALFMLKRRAEALSDFAKSGCLLSNSPGASIVLRLQVIGAGLKRILSSVGVAHAESGPEGKDR